MAKPVEVEIMGQVFSVTSDDGEEHIRRVAGYVDEKIREVMAGGKIVSSFTAAVMAALNMASECQKLQQENTETERAMERLAARLVASIEGEAGESARGPKGERVSERAIEPR